MFLFFIQGEKKFSSLYVDVKFSFKSLFIKYFYMLSCCLFYVCTLHLFALFEFKLLSMDVKCGARGLKFITVECPKIMTKKFKAFFEIFYDIFQKKIPKTFLTFNFHDMA